MKIYFFKDLIQNYQYYFEDIDRSQHREYLEFFKAKTAPITISFR